MFSLLAQVCAGFGPWTGGRNIFASVEDILRGALPGFGHVLLSPERGQWHVVRLSWVGGGHGSSVATGPTKCPIVFDEKASPSKARLPRFDFW